MSNHPTSGSPRRPAAALLVVSLLGLLLASCAQEPLGQILVTVESDLRVPEEVDALVVRTLSGGRQVTGRRIPLGAGAGNRALPGSFGISPVGGETSRAVSIEIDVMRGSCRLFTYRTTTAFAPRQATLVTAFLARQCAGSVSGDRCAPRDLCGAALTCTRGGACVAVDPSAPGSRDGGAPRPPPPRPTMVPSHGAAIAITPDDTRAVAVNRRDNSVSVFDLDLGPARTVTRRVTLTPPSTGPASRDPEAWAVVIGNDGDTAFVALRREQRVLRIDDLRGDPHFAAASAATGSEPTGLAITPSGRHLYVANFAEGTVTVVATATMHVEMTLDLNCTLARSGRLGRDVAPRLALAHPRAITITNDGDAADDDEVAYVTEFFSQARDPAEVRARDPSLLHESHPGYWDVARVGVLYRIPLRTNAPDGELITLAPVADTHFADSAGRSTGCFPNLLYSAEMSNGRLYVTGVCASPSGPVGEVCRSGPCASPPDEADVNPGNFQTMVHAAVFVVDTTMNPPVPRPAILLTEQYRGMYSQTLPRGVTTFPLTVPDDERRRMPLLPLGLAFVPGDYVSYVLGYGSDAIFRVSFTDQGALSQVGSSQNDEGFIDLAGNPLQLGRLPIGIAIGHLDVSEHRHTALVLNANTVNVSVLNLNLQRVVGVVPAAPPAPPPSPEASRVREGRRIFVTGTGRWSWRGQAWSSCESCHPDGLSDGLTWFFPRGPRQTPSLEGSFAVDGEGRGLQRLFGWMASFDEVQDVESVVRNVSGGVGAIVHRESSPPRMSDRISYQEDRAGGRDATHTATSQLALNGAVTTISAPTASGDARSVVADLDMLAAYVQTIRAPRRPVGLDPAEVAAGRATFEGSCAGCHGSALWTVSRRFYNPSETYNATRGTLRTESYVLPSGFGATLNPDTPAARTAPYRFDDLAAAGANDHIQCAMRAVGTVGTVRDGVLSPVALMDAPVREVRQNMTSFAQGTEGFNPPSLVGAALSAPYFHAGNARTLEELFDPAFVGHHSTWCQNCFGASATGRAEVRRVVEFLLSIDDDQTPSRVQGAGIGGAVDLCAQGDGLFP